MILTTDKLINSQINNDELEEEKDVIVVKEWEPWPIPYGPNASKKKTTQTRSKSQVPEDDHD